jgi:hypothetical protein
MKFKVKVIENEMPKFEEDVNEFISQTNLKILDIQYSTSGFPPDEEYGWHSAIFHNALIKYVEFEN